PSRPREVVPGEHPDRRRMGRTPGRAEPGCHESVLPAGTCSSTCSQGRRGHHYSVVFDEKSRQGLRLRIAFAQEIPGAGAEARPAVGLARRPADFDLLDAVALAEAEVEAR